MNTDTHRFDFKEEMHSIIGCAMEVHFSVLYKTVQTGAYIPDLIINFKRAKLEWKSVAL